MCGIAGVVNLKEPIPVAREILFRMCQTMQHRGPDGAGIYRDTWAGLGSTRLSIIDPDGGDQPIGNEDGTLWIVFNGEIFNFLELRLDLERRGHRFMTRCDTEVVLHLYEEYGPQCLRMLNGQFAIAIWDEQKRTLFLTRDRVGIRPVFYALQNDQFIFGSEIKSLLAHPGISARIDPQALRETFTFWSPLSPHTIFAGIQELPPAHYLLIQSGQVGDPQPYWSLDFTEDSPPRPPEDYAEELETLLIDAAQLRLRADVPVGAYLSGGLDSSITTALIQSHTAARLSTFSISFSDPNYDESSFQTQVAQFLGTDHHILNCDYKDIGRAFPEVVWHTEAPILRTSPAPMFLLSQLVHNHHHKVVLTGEGADEFLAGYDIFKEMKIRRFWSADPESNLRPRLLAQIYPDIAAFGGHINASGAFLQSFFKRDLTQTSSPYYSHLIRWKNTARTWRFLSQQYRQENDKGGDASIPLDRLPLPVGFNGWTDLAQAQYWEIITFLSPYLLSSQGDRMSMANSVEGRYPFLDHRVIEFCNRLPPEMKMPVLVEKWLLKRLGRKYLPETIWQRKKHPYRAPVHRSFFTGDPPAYVREMLSETALRRAGYFEPAAAARLADKASSSLGLSEVEDMALVGILSTQLVDQFFVRGNRPGPDRQMPNRLKVIDRLASEPGSGITSRVES